MSAPPKTPMPPMVRLILARHGEAVGSRELRFNGSSDVPLTPIGEEQARRLAEALAQMAPVAVYSSPLSRAQATATAIAHASHAPLHLLPDLREQSYGSWERLTAAEARARDPQRFAAWAAGRKIAPPAGESLTAVRQRVVVCAQGIAEAHSGQMVVLVAHVGPIKALLCSVLGLPLRGTRRFWIDLASYSLVDWRLAPDGTHESTVRAINVVTHLVGSPG
jgi:ribonuclease H / adenosylcobalamin/alpha-ribazole phosphatase